MYTKFPIVLTNVFLLISCVLGVHAQQNVQQINDKWNFKFVRSQGYTDSTQNTQVVNLPHCWGLNEAVDDIPGYLRTTACYSKNLFISKNKLSGELFLFFEGINQSAEVYVNGHIAGKHTGGYTQFYVNITKFAKAGKNNLIEVVVSNIHDSDVPPLSADFTFFGGIHRNVSLIKTNKIHFDFTNGSTTGLLITPKVVQKHAEVQICAKLSSVEKLSKNLIVETQVLAHNDSLVASSKQLISINGNSFFDFFEKLDFLNPKLWSPSNPYLYLAQIRIYDRKTGELLDTQVQKIGFRYFNFDADKGLILNGEKLKLIGVNRHQSFEGKGFAMGNELELNDIWLMKKLGCNYLRTSHYPQNQAIVDLCDELGIICSVEIPLVNEISETQQFTQNTLNMTREMIFQNYNHASVFIWAFMNEIFLVQPFKNAPERNAVYKKSVVELANKIQLEIKNIDRNRPTMIPCHGDLDLYVESGITKIPDIVGWNLYQGWYVGELEDFDKFLDDAKSKNPDKSIIVSEFGVDTDSRLHSFVPRRFDSTHEYAVKLHQYYLTRILSYNYVAGGAIWNFNDFYSEARTNALPHINDKGLVTLNREPKDVFRFYLIALSETPNALLASKDWQLRGGTLSNSGTCVQPVVVYSNTDSVSLYLNGNKIENFQKDGFIFTYAVPFVNGNNNLEVHCGSIKSDYQQLEFNGIASNLAEIPSTFESLCVMLGSNRYFYNKDKSEIWIPEQVYRSGGWGYIGGNAYEKKTRLYNLHGSDADILQTNIDPVFQTAREGIESFRLDVPKGVYKVDLFFAELRSNKERARMANELGNELIADNNGDRIFDVYINNALIFSSINLSKTCGVQTAVEKSVTISVNNQAGLQIQFEKKIGQPILNAIRITKL